MCGSRASKWVSDQSLTLSQEWARGLAEKSVWDFWSQSSQILPTAAFTRIDWLSQSLQGRPGCVAQVPASWAQTRAQSDASWIGPENLLSLVCGTFGLSQARSFQMLLSEGLIDFVRGSDSSPGCVAQEPASGSQTRASL